MDKSKEFLTESDVAKALAVTVNAVRGWRNKGMGPAFYKIGGAVRYDKAEVDAFILSSRVSCNMGSGVPPKGLTKPKVKK